MYENKVSLFNEHRVEYFALSSGFEENLSSIIESATIIEEVKMYESIPRIIEEYLIQYNALMERYKDRQKYFFRKQIELAIENGLLLVLHIRGKGTHDDAFDILQEYKEALTDNNRGRPGVLHCYGRDYATATDFTDMGFVLGIGGAITCGNSELEDTVRRMPIHSIVLETDAPYVLPKGIPGLGKRNVPENVRFVAQRVAELKGLPIEDIETMTDMVAVNVFSLPLFPNVSEPGRCRSSLMSSFIHGNEECRPIEGL